MNRLFAGPEYASHGRSSPGEVWLKTSLSHVWPPSVETRVGVSPSQRAVWKMSPAGSWMTSVSPPPSGSPATPASFGKIGPWKLVPPFVEIQRGLGWSAVAVVSSPLGAVTTRRPLPLTMLGSPKPLEPGRASGAVNPAWAVPPLTDAVGEAEASAWVTAIDRIAATKVVAMRCLLNLGSPLSEYVDAPHWRRYAPLVPPVAG